ncbi:hypothetical protein N8T08_011170 [Aspergillus melleus]|uniref:Uncharacterized protein n=1 Tax=Aspergillus melleus TaxID=138277 RepID=A0ACC3AQ19_9EURO|nr:hypothetical protein N8T08_011170 [Aspergillus melleus]
MLDNTAVLARLPYPSTKPRQLAVASEVETLALLRAHGLPVPRMYAYSTNTKDPVGSESWRSYQESHLVIGGSSYLTENVSRCFCSLYGQKQSFMLLSFLRAEAYTTPATCHPTQISASAPMQLFNGGLQSAPLSVLIAVLDPIDVLRNPALYTDYGLSDPSEHVASLKSYFKIAPKLLPSNELLRLVLRHSDIQPNNILVSDDLNIVGLIDCQHASVLPLFLAADIPKFFQNYDNPESLVFRPPPSPNLSDMDEDAKANALHDFQRHHTHFFYLAFTQRFNELHFRAIEHATNMLTRLTQAWHKYSTGPCPISFSATKSDSIMHVKTMQEKVDLQLKQIRDLIGFGVDGWTHSEEYEAACARARQAKVVGLVSLATDHEREMTNQHWPFDDHNEDE